MQVSVLQFELSVTLRFPLLRAILPLNLDLSLALEGGKADRLPRFLVSRENEAHRATLLDQLSRAPLRDSQRVVLHYAGSHVVAIFRFPVVL